MTVFARYLRNLGLALGLPVVLFAAWWTLSANSASFYAPPLSEILATFRELWLSERLNGDVVPSLTRLGVGYLLSAVTGVGLGLLLGSKRTARRALEPLLEFFRAVPPPVLVPVIMLLAGIGDSMKIVVIAIGCLWPILLNTVEGVRAVDEVMVDTSRAYGLTGLARIRHLTLPSASPQIMAGLRQSLSIGLILMVISEMFAATNGLGFAIVRFQRNFDIPEMWSGIVLLGLLGFVLSVLFAAVERRVLSWYTGQRAALRKA